MEKLILWIRKIKFFFKTIITGKVELNHYIPKVMQRSPLFKTKYYPTNRLFDIDDNYIAVTTFINNLFLKDNINNHLKKFAYCAILYKKITKDYILKDYFGKQHLVGDYIMVKEFNNDFLTPHKIRGFYEKVPEQIIILCHNDVEIPLACIEKVYLFSGKTYKNKKEK